MSMTGIGVDVEAITQFNELKQNRKHGYIVFSITDDKTAVKIEKTGPPFKKDTGPIAHNEEVYNTLMKEITAKDDPKYITFDFHYEKKDGSRREKVVFINWCPDTAPPSKKMIHSGTAKGLKTNLKCDFYFEANDYAELSREIVAEAIENKT